MTYQSRVIRGRTVSQTVTARADVTRFATIRPTTDGVTRRTAARVATDLRGGGVVTFVGAADARSNAEETTRIGRTRATAYSRVAASHTATCHALFYGSSCVESGVWFQLIKVNSPNYC